MKQHSGSWSLAEDSRCRAAVEVVASTHERKVLSQFNQFQLPIGFNWTQVAQLVGTRNSKQCRERYLNQLAPGINRDPWTEEEDHILKSFFPLYGTRWHNYTTHLDRRTENSIKLRWRTLERRRKRKKKKTVVKEDSFDFDLEELLEKEEKLEFTEEDFTMLLDFVNM